MKGNVHLLFGEYALALEAYDRAIQLAPASPTAYFDRGLAYHMNYQPLQGCRDLEKAMELGSADAADALKYFCAF